MIKTSAIFRIKECGYLYESETWEDESGRLRYYSIQRMSKKYQGLSLRSMQSDECTQAPPPDLLSP